MKSLLVINFLVLFSTCAYSQKNTNTSFQAVKEQCKNLPFEKRVRVTVSRFSVSTNTPSEFGGNLATMLTNALQGINCYRVLESLINKTDMNDEIDYGEGGYAKKSSSAKKGKQLGAQVVITGEVTEYNVKSSAARFGLVKVGSTKAKIGFVLKMINPETREVLYSQSIDVEGKTGGATEFGAFGLNLVSGESNDPAVSNACEQGIIKAVEFLASKKDSLNLSERVTANDNQNAINETEVTVTEANFNSFNSFGTLLATISAYKSAEKSLKSGTATFTVTHTGSGQALLDEINKKLAGKFEVIGFEEGKIELKTKQ